MHDDEFIEPQKTYIQQKQIGKLIYFIWFLG